MHTHIHTYTHNGPLNDSNYEALVTHVDRLTQNDARRLLRVAQFETQRRTGRRPRTPTEFFRAMESMGEVLLVNAILGRSPRSTYEVCMHTSQGVYVHVHVYMWTS